MNNKRNIIGLFMMIMIIGFFSSCNNDSKKEVKSDLTPEVAYRIMAQSYIRCWVKENSKEKQKPNEISKGQKKLNKIIRKKCRGSSDYLCIIPKTADKNYTAYKKCNAQKRQYYIKDNWTRCLEEKDRYSYHIADSMRLEQYCWMKPNTNHKRFNKCIRKGRYVLIQKDYHDGLYESSLRKLKHYEKCEFYHRGR